MKSTDFYTWNGSMLNMLKNYAWYFIFSISIAVDISLVKLYWCRTWDTEHFIHCYAAYFLWQNVDIHCIGGAANKLHANFVFVLFFFCWFTSKYIFILSFFGCLPEFRNSKISDHHNFFLLTLKGKIGNTLQ